MEPCTCLHDEVFQDPCVIFKQEIVHVSVVAIGGSDDITKERGQTSQRAKRSFLSRNVAPNDQNGIDENAVMYLVCFLQEHPALQGRLLSVHLTA